jgi:hypothetical protein
MTGLNKDNKNNNLFAVIFGVIFTLLYSTFKVVKNSRSHDEERENTRDDTKLDTNFDGYIKETVLDIGKALQQIQPFLKFNAVFQKVKDFEVNKNLADLQVFVKNEEYETEKIWRVFANLDSKIGGITRAFSTSEPIPIQRNREEFSRLNNFANSFKSLIVTRGQILRHIRNTYNGKNKREETKKREEEGLKTLVQLFQNDINRVTKETKIFNEVMENIKTSQV